MDRAVKGTGDGFVSNEAGMVDFNVSRQVHNNTALCTVVESAE